MWWVTGLLLGAGVYLGKPAFDRIGNGAGARVAFWAFFVFLMGIAGLLLVLFVLLLVRPRRHPIARAMSLARLGQFDAAISDLQRQIDTRGRSPRRCEALGDCYLLREDWRKAYIQFLEAEQLDNRGGRYLAKQGFALWKLGRAREALEPLERAAQIDPSDPSPVWTTCHVLVDLGQVTAAHEKLERAGRLIKESIPPGNPRRRALEESLEVCRQRLLLMSDTPTDSPLDANSDS